LANVAHAVTATIAAMEKAPRVAVDGVGAARERTLKYW
jgi:hypothetical protein